MTSGLLYNEGTYMPTPTKPLKVLNPLNQIKTQLEQLIPQMKNTLPQAPEHSSKLTRIIHWWHKKSLWVKGLIGVVIIIPLLIGCIIEAPILITLGSTLALFFAVGAYLLHDHQPQKQNPDQVQIILNQWADLLSTVMNTLTQCREKIAQEICGFHTENQTLKETNQTYQQEIKKLEQANKVLEIAHQELIKVQQQLNSTLTVTDETLIAQRSLLQKSQKLLDETISAYQKDQEALNQTITELTETKDNLIKHIAQAYQITMTLKKTILNLIQLSIAKETQKETFLKKIEDIIDNQERQLECFVKEISESTRQLNTTTLEIKANNEHVSGLLTRQAESIKHLEHTILTTSNPRSTGNHALKFFPSTSTEVITGVNSTPNLT